MFERYIAWQPYSVVIRTRHGFRMRTQITDLLSCAIYMTGQWEPYLTAYMRRLDWVRTDVFVDVLAQTSGTTPPLALSGWLALVAASTRLKPAPAITPHWLKTSF